MIGTTAVLTQELAYDLLVDMVCDHGPGAQYELLECGL